MQRLFEPLGFKRKVPRPMAVRADAAPQQAQGRVGRGVEGASRCAWGSEWCWDTKGAWG